MTITYYPEKNHLIAKGEDGRMVGFIGKTAERMLRSFIENDQLVTIGSFPKKAARPKFSILIFKN